jgi:Fe-S oxidoreductase
MALLDYRNDMETCRRCSACKFIPLEKVSGQQRVNVCPSIARYNFHAYSGGGRMVNGAAFLAERLNYSDKLLEVTFNCQMCGACDVSCKYAMDMEVTESLYEFRAKCIKDGQTLPELYKVVTHLREKGTPFAGSNVKRGDWAEGIGVKDVTKERASVLYYAGCRTSLDPPTWNIAQTNVRLLQKAGIDVGILGAREVCCGGRVYQMGYQADFFRQAKANMKMLSKFGVKTLVTGCAECYHAFKVLYEKYHLKGDLEVLHTTEYFARLIKEGKLKPSKTFTARVTYHDPCHLGRLGEPWIHWEGKSIPGHMRVFDPPKEFRRGTYGAYQPARDVLMSIPGIKLVEMDRIKEYTWCCGAGGGVKETNPAFADWTAKERLEEAGSTGAEFLVTACPGCLKNLKDGQTNKSKLKIVDITEILEKSVK